MVVNRAVAVILLIFFSFGNALKGQTLLGNVLQGLTDAVQDLLSVGVAERGGGVK